MAAAPELIRPQWPAPAGILALSTTRPGGCSEPPYDSFNLGAHVGDDPAHVQANRDLLASVLPPGTVVPWLEQVHGVDVVPAERAAPGTRADAVWTRTPGYACAVMTADCLPVLFCTTAGDCVAAAHAGWRGLLGGVLEATIEAMAVPGSQLLAWLGPAIGPAVFEVGAEVRTAYLEAATDAEHEFTASCFRPSSEQRYLADLYSLARQRLARCQVTRVSGGDACTFTDDGRFFSFRRDGATGRMVSLVMLGKT